MLLTNLETGILTLTLNRPDKRNALSAPLLAALSDGLDRADLDREVRVIAIRGAGRDFCAGADLEELLASADKSVEENEQAALVMGQVFLRMRQIPKPVVAVVQGRALAGGAGLATGCDLIVATESARFGYPEIQRGFVPAMVMTLLKRLVGEKVAFDLAATGRLLTAHDAAGLGLISRVFPDADFETNVREVLKGLASASPTALAFTKKQFYQLDGMGVEEGIRLGARVNALSRATPDFRTAIAAFLKPEQK
ncbi:MAG: enoyl-CoA hydratase/isomerase family protein [Gemmatimonadota bacterium]